MPRSMSAGWTIRARLTALYGVLFLLSGVLLLGVTYLLVQQNIRQRATQSPLKVPPELTIGLGNGTEIQIKRFVAELQRQRSEHEERTLNAVLTQGSIALGGVMVIGLGFGWLVSERALRPVHKITATARRVAEGNLTERIALTGPRDEITELADTFDLMLERLDHSFHSQRRFVGDASHELRTPLAINRTLIEVALGRPDPPPELVQLGQNLLAVNSRTERLIDGLLTLARSDQALTVREPVDLAAVAQHVVAALPSVTAPAPEATAQVVAALPSAAAPTLEVTAQPAGTVGDPVLLERVVQNLIDNALAYNLPAAGRVWVETGVRAGAARLVVSNTGPVIPGYEVGRLFEPFYRARARTGSATGTGLGLAIVRSVVTAHRGTVRAQARPEGGLTVTVTLPAATPAGPGAGPKRA